MIARRFLSEWQAGRVHRGWLWTVETNAHIACMPRWETDHGRRVLGFGLPADVANLVLDAAEHAAGHSMWPVLFTEEEVVGVTLVSGHTRRWVTAYLPQLLCTATIGRPWDVADERVFYSYTDRAVVDPVHPPIEGARP